MLKLSHAALVLISGLVWLAVGLFLFPLGLKLLVGSATAYVFSENSYPLISLLTPYLGPQQAAIFLIVIGLFIGQLKGKTVLNKSIQRSIKRIKTFPNPTSITNLYSYPYLILLISMVGLGISIRYFGVPNDIRGFIDVAVGAALIRGALNYFREAQALRKKVAESQ